MKFMHSVRWLLLALLVFAATAQQRASAQAPGTLKTGTFVWDGARWMPVENPAPPPEAAPVADEEVVTDDAPPPLPVYEQPPCPEPNLIWTPGNWHWGLLGYYWVPGAWVPAPYAGALWTPPYWGWAGGRYAFHAGYWGPHVGFYGGVNYGGGFMGIGFSGGTWNGGVFAYNTAVVHVNANVVTNVYVNRTIVEQTTIVNTSHVAFNGGPNGIQHQPTADEQVALHPARRTAHMTGWLVPVPLARLVAGFTRSTRSFQFANAIRCAYDTKAFCPVKCAEICEAGRYSKLLRLTPRILPPSGAVATHAYVRFKPPFVGRQAQKLLELCDARV